MANSLKLNRSNILRQHSLSNSSSPKQKQPLLKKQLSVDSNYTKPLIKSKPPPGAPRLAWQEDSNNVEIVATKCSEHQKVGKTNQYPLADRLRKSWADRETEFSNNKSINIFLARTINDEPPSPGISRESTIDVAERNEEKEKKISLVIAPLADTEAMPSAATRRDNFRRNSKKTGFSTCVDIPDDEFDVIVERRRPPLVKSQSVPSSPAAVEPAKIRQPKRRLKTAPIRRRNTLDETFDTNTTVEHTLKKKSTKKKTPSLARCRSAQTASDIVTMVSITSPPLSDSEETVQKNAANLAKIRKQNLEKKAEINAKLEAQRLITLKKIVKSVTFQPSIYTCSTTAAPSTAVLRTNHSSNIQHVLRRGSLAPPSGLTLPIRAILQSKDASESNASGEREKRNNGQLADEHEAKRGRLINDDIIRMEPVAAPAESDKPSMKDEQDNVSKSVCHQINSDKTSISATTIDEMKCQQDPNEPIFDTPKEKQCWKLYRKMCDKGVDVSFDTILKGILTPTEYRLRTKLQTIDDIKTNKENEQSSSN